MTAIIASSFCVTYFLMLVFVYRCAVNLRSWSWKIINLGFLVGVSYRLVSILFLGVEARSIWWNVWPFVGAVLLAVGFWKLSRDVEAKRLRKFLDTLG